MWPNLVSFGRLTITGWGIYLVAAVILASFALWKKLRTDFPDEEIFGFTLSLALGMAVGGILTGVVETGKWLEPSGWGLVAGGFWALRRWCSEHKWDFWEIFDWIAVLALWFWLVGSLAYGPAAVYSAAAAFVGIIISWYVRTNYRKFPWYSSGKVGIVGLITVLVYAVYEIVIAIIKPATIYWWGLTMSQTIAAWVVAFCLVTVYLRGGNKFFSDVKILKKKQ